MLIITTNWQRLSLKTSLYFLEQLKSSISRMLLKIEMKTENARQKVYNFFEFQFVVKLKVHQSELNSPHLKLHSRIDRALVFLNTIIKIVFEYRIFKGTTLRDQ